MSLGSDLWVRLSFTMSRFADVTDVTLVDEDTKSILTDNANRVIQGNQAMHVTIVWCANLLVMQVVPSGGQICKYSSSGQIWNQYNW